MHPLFITAAVDAALLLCEPRGAALRHILSLGDPGAAPPRGLAEHPARKLRVEFDDLERDPAPGFGYVAVQLAQVRAMLDFLVACDGPALIHCAAGKSRSTAAGLLLLAHRLGPGREAEAVAELKRIRPAAWPNRRIVGMGDELLGRGGALIAADLAWRPGIVDRSGVYGYDPHADG
jgi:predicted protein tyrosine phosphatase